MSKKLLLFSFVFATAAAQASFTPGRYEIQNLGGLPIGTLAVSWEKSTFNELPATRIIWEFNYSAEPYRSTEKHEAFVSKDGLEFFRKVVTDDKGKSVTEGQISGDLLRIIQDDHGQKITTGAPRKSFVVSDYDLEADHSPFKGMKMKTAKSAPVFSVRELKSVNARRNVNSVAQIEYGGRMIAANKVSTSFSNTVTTSWFMIKSQMLLKEQWADRQFVRVGD